MSELQVATPAEIEPAAPPVPGPWRRAARAALITWVAAYVAYGLISLFAWRVSKEPTPTLRDIFGMWKWQDVSFYTGIVEGGYQFHPDAPAFYPLYPMVSWVVDQITPGGALIACAIVSAACAYAAMLLLFRLVDLEFGAETANRAVLYLAAFPMAFYLFHAYNASMCVMLGLGALHTARRGNWWAAGALAGLAGTTRLFGLLLAVPLAYEYLRQRDWRPARIRWDALSFGLIPLGLLGYALYCQVALGSWRAFIDAQASWQRAYGWPGQSLFEAIRLLVVHGPRDGSFVPNEYYMITLFEAGTVLAALVLTVLGLAGPWRLRRDQYFLLIATLVPLLAVTATMVGDQRWLMSAPRYALEWTAPFIVLARIGRNPFVDRIYVTAGFGLQAIMLATITTQAHWVA
jgi:hypothetical protein